MLTGLQCAQGIGIGSNGSIAFRRILTITTIWGICSSLDSQPQPAQQIGFGHSFATLRADDSRYYNEMTDRWTSRVSGLLL